MIQINSIYKSFEERTVLNDISFTFENGKTNLIIGQSGSGKTVLMKCLVGLLTPEKGEVLYDGRNLINMGKKEKKALRREMGMIFQSAALFDSLSVLENVMFPLDMFSNQTYRERVKRAQFCLDRVNLIDAQKKYPGEISGGMQKRVAIARALVKLPRVLLLDEPLSNLDARLRLQTREEIRRIQQETQITTIFVTHDQDEAMSISDMIVVMKDGIVQQIGKPQNVYDDPVNLFVAKFLGTPPINVFSGEVKNEQLYIGSEAVLSTPGVSDQPVHVGIRPEGFVLKEDGPLSCDLVRLEVMGRDVSIVSTHEKSQNVTIRSIIDADEGKSLPTGKVHFALKPAKVFLFCTDTEERIRF